MSAVSKDRDCYSLSGSYNETNLNNVTEVINGSTDGSMQTTNQDDGKCIVS
jgi:hypothetical protein